MGMLSMHRLIHASIRLLRQQGCSPLHIRRCLSGMEIQAQPAQTQD